MPYPPNGTLTTDKREVAIDETWETQTDWEAYQSITDIEITNGTVQLPFSNYPGTAIHRYDASELTGFTDGDPVTTWTDEIGSLDLTGNGTYRSTAFNGNAAVEFDGVDDTFVNTFTEITAPYTVYAVAELTGNETNDPRLVSLDGAGSPYSPYFRQGSWAVFAGSVLSGSSDQTIQQLTTVVDGVNGVIREEGTQTNTGDAGNGSATGIRLGARGVDGSSPDNFWQGYISEIVFCDDRDINTTFENFLLSKWGIQ